MTNQTTDLKINIQECNNILKKVIFREIMCGHPSEEFCGQYQLCDPG